MALLGRSCGARVSPLAAPKSLTRKGLKQMSHFILGPAPMWAHLSSVSEQSLKSEDLSGYEVESQLAGSRIWGVPRDTTQEVLEPLVRFTYRSRFVNERATI